VGAALARFHVLLATCGGAAARDLAGFSCYAGLSCPLRCALRPRRTATATSCARTGRSWRSGVRSCRCWRMRARRGKLGCGPIHGDPKLNNFLFEAGSARVASLNRPRHRAAGVGALRHRRLPALVLANPAGEVPADLARWRFDLELAGAFCTGTYGRRGCCRRPSLLSL